MIVVSCGNPSLCSPKHKQTNLIFDIYFFLNIKNGRKKNLVCYSPVINDWECQIYPIIALIKLFFCWGFFSRNAFNSGYDSSEDSTKKNKMIDAFYNTVWQAKKKKIIKN